MIPAGFVIANMRQITEDLPGWLLLDGRTVQSADYPDLDAACSHWHGPGSITLILPDTRLSTLVDGREYFDTGTQSAFLPDLEYGGDPDQELPHLKMTFCAFMVKT